MFLRNKFVALILCGAMLCSQAAFCEPVVGGVPLPPASFTYIDDIATLEKIGLDGFDGAWCYDTHANAILITAPARAKAQCELKLKFELEKQKAKHNFEVDRLKVKIDMLTEQHEQISLIKNQEIEKLTAAALKRPNDYSVWWATGGFVVGLATSFLAYVVITQ